MVGEVVALVAKGADPDEGGEIDAGEGRDNRGAGFAVERRVGERENGGVGVERRERGGERDDAFREFDFGAGPGVPCHTHAVDVGLIGLGQLGGHGGRGVKEGE